jgi:hypothetical protein
VEEGTGIGVSYGRIGLNTGNGKGNEEHTDVVASIGISMSSLWVIH